LGRRGKKVEAKWSKWPDKEIQHNFDNKAVSVEKERQPASGKRKKTNWKEGATGQGKGPLNTVKNGRRKGRGFTRAVASNDPALS